MTEYRNNEKNRRSRWFIIAINILIMAGVAMLLGWIALSWLDIWTGHGKELVVPDVRGMKYDVAEERLTDNGFVVEIADSVYDNKVGPGVVVDQNPHRDTKVKPGRMIYVTINAFSPKSVTLPRLTDLSVRQVRAILGGLGLKNITEQSVISEFKDLVLGVRCNGNRISAGARVPVNAHIILEVGDGMPELDDNGDSISSVQPVAEPVERLDLH